MMKRCGTIKYRGVDYPCRNVRMKMPDDEYRRDYLIASDRLNAAMFKDTVGYADRTARLIDGGIFFFAPDDILDKKDIDVVKYVKGNL